MPGNGWLPGNYFGVKGLIDSPDLITSGVKRHLIFNDIHSSEVTQLKAWGGLGTMLPDSGTEIETTKEVQLTELLVC